MRQEKIVVHPISLQQKRIWGLQNATGQVFNSLLLLKINGSKPLKSAQIFLEKLTAKHEIFRSTFLKAPARKYPVQTIEDNSNVRIDTEYLSSNQTLEDILQRERFSNDNSNISKTIKAVFIVGDNENYFCLTIPALMADRQTLIALYKNFISGTLTTTISEKENVEYIDFCEWQNDLVKGNQASNSKYWEKFDNSFEAKCFPFERRPKFDEEYSLKCLDFPIEKKLYDQLRNFAKDREIDIDTIFLTCWYVVLNRYDKEMTFGYNLAGRSNETQKVAGPFEKYLPLNIGLNEKDTLFGAVIKVDQLKRSHLAFHESYGLPTVNTEGKVNYFPFCYDSVVINDFNDTNIELVSVETFRDFYKIRFVHTASSSGTQFQFRLWFDSRKFDSFSMNSLFVGFLNLVKAVVQDENIEISSVIVERGEEFELIKNTFNPNEKENRTGEKSIPAACFTSKKKQTTSPALLWDQGQLTYTQLDQMSNQVANYLIGIGITKGEVVALALDRSEWLFVCLMGVLKSGAAFLPIDKKLPANRINYLLQDSRCKFVIMDGVVSSQLKMDVRWITLTEVTDLIVFESDKTPNLVISEGDPAYVIYTSGTTGTPKGVLVSHGSIVNYSRWVHDTFQLNHKDRSLLFTSHSFDLCYTGIWPLFFANASIYLAPEQEFFDPVVITRLICNEKITFLKLTPSHFSLINDVQEFKQSKHQLRQVILGGEKIKIEEVENFLDASPNTQIANHYGPTETTVGAIVNQFSKAELDRFNQIDIIGKPIAFNQIYILNVKNQLLPIGVIGQIAISGPGVAMGYINNQMLSEEYFPLDRFIKESKMYLTGDLGRWLPDGRIELVGRNDDQLNLHGYRIEPREIEHVLSKHPKVEKALVVSRHIGLDESKKAAILVAYWIHNSNEGVEKIDFTDYLSSNLPAYMVPEFYVEVENFPYTGNGKLNLNALPNPTFSKSETQVRPPNSTEELLQEIWKKVLGRSKIEINDDFFWLGGDSIKAIQIASRLHQHGFKVEVRQIFESRTIAQLSGQVKIKKHSILQVEVRGEVLLSPIQHEFFTTHHTRGNHYNQSLLLSVENDVRPEQLEKIFVCLLTHHDALRMVFQTEGTSITQVNQAVGSGLYFEYCDLSDEHSDSNLMERKILETHTSMRIDGPLVRVVYFQLADTFKLLIVIHHLVVDTVSWRIILEDLRILWDQTLKNEPLMLPEKTDSYQNWASRLSAFANSKTFLAEIKYWKELDITNIDCLKSDTKKRSKDSFQFGREIFEIDKEVSSLLLLEANKAFNTGPNDILVTSLYRALRKTFNVKKVAITMEGHGRDEIVSDMDITRTVGWFTDLYPLIIEEVSEKGEEDLITVKETLAKIPFNGLSYGILKYLTSEEHKVGLDLTGIQPQIKFNYLGQFDSDFEQSGFRNSDQSSGPNHGEQTTQSHGLEITAVILKNKLHVGIGYNGLFFKKKTMELLSKAYNEELNLIIKKCAAKTKPELTPNDLTFKEVNRAQFQSLKRRYKNPILDIYRLSPMQEGILYHSLMDSSSYFNQLSYRLDGKLDVEAVIFSLKSLIKRHEILRTTFKYIDEEIPFQIVLENRDVDLNYIDLRENKKRQEIEVAEYKQTDLRQSFNLENDALLRVAILHLDHDCHEVVWSHHHILFDGWSSGILQWEYNQLYNSYIRKASISLPEVRPYKWYIKWLAEKDKEISLQFWRDYLKGYEQQVGLPKKDLSNKKNQNYHHNRVVFSLDIDQSKMLEDVANDNHVTTNTVIQAIWGILLSRYNEGASDLVYGSVVSGRPAEIEGVERMVGLFINTVPVRVQLDKTNSFDLLIKTIQHDALERENHQYCSLAEIQSESTLKQYLLDHVMVFENYPLSTQLGLLQADEAKKNVDGLQIRDFSFREQINYDFSIVIVPGPELTVRLEYNAQVYDNSFVAAIEGHFKKVVKQVCMQPTVRVTDLEILSDDEKSTVLEHFNRNEVMVDDSKTLLELLRQKMRQRPMDIAVECNGQTLTYDALDEKSNQIANFLVRHYGIGPNDYVGILMERSENMVAAVLGIMKSGAAFLPIDISFPMQRIAHIVQDSCCEVVFCNESVHLNNKEISEKCHEIQECFKEDTSPITPNLIPEDAIYAIYTSGSTGVPKCVVQTHRCLSNLLQWQVNCGLFDKGSRMLQISSISFDSLIVEIAFPLLSGGTIIIAPDEVKTDMMALGKFIVKQRIQVFMQAASALNILMEISEELLTEENSLKNIISCAEQLKIGGSLYRFLNRFESIILHNFYGPSETHVVASNFEITMDPDTRRYQPVGKPVPNSRVYILDKSFKPVPIGANGDLYFSGGCLSKGYLNDPEMNSLKFLPNPFCSGELIYNSGDFGRWLSSGRIEYLGRKDNQVKVRGFRIELGEVECALLQCEGIQETAVVIRQDNNGNNYIAAYFISGQPYNRESLIVQLKEVLPSYMIPGAIVKLEEFPLTGTGKVDKKNLPDPQQAESRGAGREPTTELEKKLISICVEVLGRTNIGMDDDFFALGGHSLMGTRMISRIAKEFDLNVELRAIFNYPRLGDLAEFLEKQQEMIVTEQ